MIRARYLGDKDISHILKRAFISNAADEIFKNMFGEYSRGEGVPWKIQCLITSFVVTHVLNFGITDSEGLVPVYLHLVQEDVLGDEFAAAIAKPRDIHFNRGHTSILWGVVILAREELNVVMDLPPDERDNKLTSMVGMHSVDSRWWTKPTIERDITSDISSPDT